MLKMASSGVAVSNLQKNLNATGMSIVVDGFFGIKTENAVKAFQKAEGLVVDGIVGPKTQTAIAKRLSKPLPKELVSTPVETVPEVLPVVEISETPWMDYMKLHDGEHEIAGKEDNPFIMDLYQYGNYPREHDEVPWCAVLANAALIKHGYVGTRRADAKSFDKCGDACEIKYGCIITIKHKDGSRHVTFFDHWVDEEKQLMACRGGNQSNALKVSTYDVSGNKKGHDEVVASRWPRKAA